MFYKWLILKLCHCSLETLIFEHFSDTLMTSLICNNSKNPVFGAMNIGFFSERSVYRSEKIRRENKIKIIIMYFDFHFVLGTGH